MSFCKPSWWSCVSCGNIAVAVGARRRGWWQVSTEGRRGRVGEAGTVGIRLGEVGVGDGGRPDAPAATLAVDQLINKPLDQFMNSVQGMAWAWCGRDVGMGVCEWVS